MHGHILFLSNCNLYMQVQKDMDRLGLRIFNANIAEMHDLDAANKYFETLKQKALETAKTEMRIEVNSSSSALLWMLLHASLVSNRFCMFVAFKMRSML